MDRWVAVALIVGAAFTFAVVCTLAGGLFALPALPGMAITWLWLERNVLRDSSAFLAWSVAVNTLLYSALFGLLLWLWRRVSDKLELRWMAPKKVQTIFGDDPGEKNS